MEKSSKADRARQFMPFAALRGFEELIRQQTAEPCPRRELSEEESLQLSKKLRRVERGMLVTVRFYEQNGYITLQGMVSDIDFAIRRLTVVRKQILFDDLSDIFGEELVLPDADHA